jgi:hypothetical protein
MHREQAFDDDENRLISARFALKLRLLVRIRRVGAAIRPEVWI